MLIDLSDFGVVLRIFDMEMPREVELPRTRELVEVFDYSSDDSWTIYHNNVSNLSRSVSKMGESVWNVSVGCVRTTLRSVGAPGNSRSGRSNSRPKSCTYQSLMTIMTF